MRDNMKGGALTEVTFYTCNFRAAEMLVGVPPNPLDFWPS